ncbi:MAG: argininosuccinate lyase [Clostridia bacterium]
MSEGPVEMRGRLEGGADDVILRHIYGPRLRADLAKTPYLTEINLAHVIMLDRQGIICRGITKRLLRTLLLIDSGGPEVFQLEENLEGLYFNYERYVIEQLGARTGGTLHTGRSRNDLGATMSRMQVRDYILDILDHSLDFRRILLHRALVERDNVLTGYTHLQPAQPITMGHYLSGVERALARDTRRLFNTYHDTNQSCMGAAALAGTGFPIDRELTATLLGFDGFIENTLDAVAGRDYLIELLGNMANMATTLSRFAQDLYVWYTHEFAIIRLPDRLGGTSSIMPQKKNPVVLESPRGRLSHVIGALSSALAAIKNTNYSNVTDVNDQSFHLLENASGHLMSSLELLRATVSGMEVDSNRMREMAAENFSTATQLADELVRSGNYSFREAHHLVGSVVRRATELRMKATDITLAFVDRAAEDMTGRVTGLSERTVREALDPEYCVRVRSHAGGPSPETLERSVAGAQTELTTHRQRVESMREALDEARKGLRRVAEEIVAEDGE